MPPPKRHECIRRIKAISGEFIAASFAVERLLTECTRDPTRLIDEVPLSALRTTRSNLPGTYLIRIFAEFESALRDYWLTLRPTRPQTRILLDRIAAMQRVSFLTLANAHAVREFRNSLVHERDNPSTPLPLSEATRHLVLFFSHLPPTW